VAFRAVCYTVRIPNPGRIAGERCRLDILSPVHLILILVAALLVFGPKRLPEIGKGLGKTIREFKQAMQEGPDDAGSAPAPSKEDEVH